MLMLIVFFNFETKSKSKLLTDFKVCLAKPSTSSGDNSIINFNLSSDRLRVIITEQSEGAKE